MQPPAKTITETTLSTSLKELAHSLVRELAMAIRKVSIYGADHPMAMRAVEKPFVVLSRFFRYKRYVNLNLQQGALYAVNIRLLESVFASELVRHLQTFELSNVVFDKGLSVDDLRAFAKLIVTTSHASNPAANLAERLQNERVSTVRVDSELGFEMFEQTRQYRGDVGGDITVRTMALNLLAGDPDFLADIENCDQEALLSYRVDFLPEIVEYLLPEKIGAIPGEQFSAWIHTCVAEAASAPSSAQQRLASDRGQALCRLLRFHNDGSEIARGLKQTLAADWLSEIYPSAAPSADNLGDDGKDASGTVKIMLDNLFADRQATEADAFTETFTRLIRTGQRGKATAVARGLIDHLSSPDVGERQKSLAAVLAVLEMIRTAAEDGVFAELARYLGEKVTSGGEAFEYSELLRQVMDRCAGGRRYDVMADLAEAMSSRRQIDNGVTIYTSMAVKQARDHLVRSHLIEDLVDELMTENRATVAKIRRVLVALGGQRVATVLSHIVTYPNRQVRQNVLRILSELGKASLDVFSRILMDDAMFEREPGRRELPQERWYVVRNSIYVLGRLQDRTGVIPLRLRINDPDVRVRREIVSSLENIGGEESCDLLVVMADDPDFEIAESAIIAAGLVGDEDMAPLVADVATRRPALATRTACALGQIGGAQARRCLSRWLSDAAEFEKVTRGGVSRDDLRLAVVKALGRIGDKEALDRIRQFKKSLSLTHKLLPTSSLLSRTIDEILSRQ